MAAVEAVYGRNAGMVWRALNEKGKLGMSDISKHTKLSTLDVSGALGWLARENKVRIVEIRSRTLYELTGR